MSIERTTLNGDFDGGCTAEFGASSSSGAGDEISGNNIEHGDDIEHVESLSPAERILVSFLAEHTRCAPAHGMSVGDEESFDALCAAHPELAGELRRLHAEWARVDRVLANGGASAAEHGRGPTKNDPAPRVDSVALDELIAGLGRHGPQRSRYRIEGSVGRGGMGDIERAWDPDLRRYVAMKSLRPRRKLARRDHDDRVLGRFLEEAQITGQLEHPGIVPVHELGVDADGKLYFTMPLVRGRELKDVIELARERRDGWNTTRALGVFLKVCEAVAYAHSKGVLHRDLKPSNVMVGRYGETYVMDWGLARVLGRADETCSRARFDSSAPPSELVDTDIRERIESTPDSPLITRDGAVLGTAPYMAPEQAEGRIEELSPRADIYSIGAMLYQLLTGQMPYVPSGSPVSPHTVLAARLLGPPQRVLEVAPAAPAELAAICEKAMHIDPRRRYASALDLAADIEAFLGHRPVSAFESSLAHVLRLAIKRNKKLALALAASFVIALAWGVTHLAQRSAYASELRSTADHALAQVLRAEADELWPATPEHAPRMRRWLARVGDVLSRAEGRPEQLAASAGSSEALAAFAANLAWLASEREVVAARAEQAETLVARTIDAHADEWKAACDSIASLGVYGGLKLAPQRGLVPLQLNPTSGLWEFWVEASGAEPRIADVATGKLALDEKSALVLVLIPGGQYASAWTEKIAGVAGTTLRKRTITLAPYFIGRTEVPQSVWVRLMGSNPSRYQAPSPSEHDNSPLAPVEYVDWHDATRFTARLALRLPTEAQWERAARAGESEPTAFGIGDDIGALAGRENLFDQTWASLIDAKATAPFNDGFQTTSPVASYLANGLGLHDVLGNVMEWCAEPYLERVPMDGLLADGSVDAEPSRFRAWRGGSHFQGSTGCRIDLRQFGLPNNANQTLGLRVARPVE